MLSPDHKKILEQLPHSQFGVVLKAYLDEEYARLKDVSNAKSWDDTLGRQQAIKILEKLFKFMDGKPIVDNGKSLYE